MVHSPIYQAEFEEVCYNCDKSRCSELYLLLFQPANMEIYRLICLLPLTLIN